MPYKPVMERTPNTLYHTSYLNYNKERNKKLDQKIKENWIRLQPLLYHILSRAELKVMMERTTEHVIHFGFRIVTALFNHAANRSKLFSKPRHSRNISCRILQQRLTIF